MIDLEEAARQADADAEYDRQDAEERRETPRTPWTVRLHDTTIEILDADGAPVQWTKRSPKSEACAALIVDAMNMYAAGPLLAAGLARIDSLTDKWQSNKIGGADLHRARWIRLGEIARLVLRQAGERSNRL
jgi:hypothetical protein